MPDIETKFLRFNPALGCRIEHIRLVERIAMIAGIDDQDIALFNCGFLGDHFGGVEAIILHHVGNINDHARAAQFF